jgi:hypothetical protein
VPKPRTYSFRIATDTATLAVFDPECLRHRVADKIHDWWTLSEMLAEETTAANLFALNLGADGDYEVFVHLYEGAPDAGTECVSGEVICASGELFIGPGEDISADGFEPDGSSGRFVRVPRGRYLICCATDESGIDVWLELLEAQVG